MLNLDTSVSSLWLTAQTAICLNGLQTFDDEKLINCKPLFAVQWTLRLLFLYLN